MAPGLTNNSNLSSPSASSSAGSHHQDEDADAIAIVGMACRFPQEAENPERFWQLLLNARSALTEFPAHKLNIDAHYHPDPAHGGTVSLRQILEVLVLVCSCAGTRQMLILWPLFLLRLDEL